jgi:putative phosphoesterase
MILGVMSDTHGNRSFLQAAAQALLTTHRADVLVHLGDNYDDGEALAALAPEVRLVPGLWCSQYRDGRVKNVVSESFGPLRTAYAHADHDLPTAAATARLALFGHTHVACIEPRGNTVWVNPGHLKARTDRAQPASYATIAIDEEHFDVSIFEFSGALRRTARFPIRPEAATP